MVLVALRTRLRAQAPGPPSLPLPCHTLIFQRQSSPALTALNVDQQARAQTQAVLPQASSLTSLCLSLLLLCHMGPISVPPCWHGCCHPVVHTEQPLLHGCGSHWVTRKGADGSGGGCTC